MVVENNTDSYLYFSDYTLSPAGGTVTVPDVDYNKDNLLADRINSMYSGGSVDVTSPPSGFPRDINLSGESSGGGGGTPGGSDGEVQYNNGGSFGGINLGLLTVDPATGQITAVADAGEGDLGFGFRLDTSDNTINGLLVQPAAGADTSGVAYFRVKVAGNAESLEVGGQDTGESYLILGNSSDLVGFFGATPAAQQAEPTTMNEVVALLQTYGLSA